MKEIIIRPEDLKGLEMPPLSRLNLFELKYLNNYFQGGWGRSNGWFRKWLEDFIGLSPDNHPETISMAKELEHSTEKLARRILNIYGYDLIENQTKFVRLDDNNNQPSEIIEENKRQPIAVSIIELSLFPSIRKINPYDPIICTEALFANRDIQTALLHDELRRHSPSFQKNTHKSLSWHLNQLTKEIHKSHKATQRYQQKLTRHFFFKKLIPENLKIDSSTVIPSNNPFIHN